MGATASQITSLTIVFSTVYSDADQRKHQSSASLAFVLGIHRGPVNSPHKWSVTRKMFLFDDVIILLPFHDAIWRQKYFTTMAQIMACCLTAPGHYLNHWSLDITNIHPTAMLENKHKIWGQKGSFMIKVLNILCGQWVNGPRPLSSVMDVCL